MIFKHKDILENKFGIYMIRNVVNNRVYIGQTGQSFKRRYWMHLWKLNNNQHDNIILQRAWNKYGQECFVFEVVEVVTDKTRLDSLETSYIQNYKKSGGSYNILDVASTRRGIPMSEKAKRLVGEKNRVHMNGKKHSDETKRRMSLSRIGKEYTRIKKTNVLNEDIVVEVKRRLMFGDNIKTVADTLGVTYGSVNGILSNDSWSNVIVEGWNEFINSRKKTYRLTYDIALKIREEYSNGSSITELCKKYNKERHTISNIIHYRTFK